MEVWRWIFIRVLTRGTRPVIMDHIKYLKTAIETLIVGRDGTSHPLSGRFLELYPKPAEIKQLCPCAALSHRPGKSTKNGSYNDRMVDTDGITLVKTLYDVDAVYQVDFFSTDIYDFLEKTASYTGMHKQLVNLIANNDSYAAASDGRTISVLCGPHGIIDTGIVEEGVYKAFCQVTFKDGIYSSIKVPRITGITINEGGLK